MISGHLNFLPHLETTIFEIDWINNMSAINRELVLFCTGLKTTDVILEKFKTSCAKKKYQFHWWP